MANRDDLKQKADKASDTLHGLQDIASEQNTPGNALKDKADEAIRIAEKARQAANEASDAALKAHNASIIAYESAIDAVKLAYKLK